MLSIEWFDSAEQQLIEQFEYIAKNNITIAQEICNEINNAIDELPQTYNHYQYMGNKTKFKCMLVHKREFRIIFDINEQNQTIRIQAILHHKQDIKKYL